MQSLVLGSGIYINYCVSILNMSIHVQLLVLGSGIYISYCVSHLQHAHTYTLQSLVVNIIRGGVKCVSIYMAITLLYSSSKSIMSHGLWR